LFLITYFYFNFQVSVPLLSKKNNIFFRNYDCHSSP
jgi:hypothetical protein